LLEKKVKPPFKSKSASQEDTNNFHKARHTVAMSSSPLFLLPIS